MRSPPVPPGSSPDPLWRQIAALAIPGLEERFSLPVWLLFVSRVINVFALSSAFPFLARHLVEDRGLSATLAGAVYTVQGVAGAFFQLVGGELTDRFGRRRVVVATLWTRAALVLVLGALVHLRAPVWALVVLVVTNSLLAGLYMPAADGLVVDHAPPERRIAAFAHQRVAVNMGWALGPLVGGLITSHLAYAAMFAAASPLLLGAGIVLSRLPQAPVVRPAVREHPFAALGRTLSDRGLRVQLAGALLTYVLATQLIATLSLDATQRLGLTSAQLGLVWTVNGALVVFLQMPVARIVQRLGTRRSLVAGSLCYGLFFTAVGFATSLSTLIACIVGVTAAELLNAPAQQGAVSERASPEELGRALGLLGLVTMLGRSLGPLAGGALLDTFPGSPRVTWGLLGSVGLVAAWLYLRPTGSVRPRGG